MVWFAFDNFMHIGFGFRKFFLGSAHQLFIKSLSLIVFSNTAWATGVPTRFSSDKQLQTAKSHTKNPSLASKQEPSGVIGSGGQIKVRGRAFSYRTNSLGL